MRQNTCTLYLPEGTRAASETDPRSCEADTHMSSLERRLTEHELAFVERRVAATRPLCTLIFTVRLARRTPCWTRVVILGEAGGFRRLMAAGGGGGGGGAGGDGTLPPTASKAL